MEYVASNVWYGLLMGYKPAAGAWTSYGNSRWKIEFCKVNPKKNNQSGEFLKSIGGCYATRWMANDCLNMLESVWKWSESLVWIRHWAIPNSNICSKTLTACIHLMSWQETQQYTKKYITLLDSVDPCYLVKDGRGLSRKQHWHHLLVMYFGDVEMFNLCTFSHLLESGCGQTLSCMVRWSCPLLRTPATQTGTKRLKKLSA